MERREPRKRIAYVKKGVPAIEDELAYTRNKCSENARKIESINPNLIFEVWFDKHYQIRKQFGDENGAREGIDSKNVKSLVLSSMRYLVAYSSILKTFTFINHEMNVGRANRIILQEYIDEGKLNVVIEAHLIDVKTYEITVKTAMCSDTFSINDGQFALEVIDNESILRKMERGQLKEVCAL
jgi:hypothetical protein